MIVITPLYAGCIALVFIALSARVILYRRRNLISLGDAGDKSLLKRMRAQANCAEYAPIGLILLALTELQGAPGSVIHALTLPRLGSGVRIASPAPTSPSRRIRKGHLSRWPFVR